MIAGIGIDIVLFERFQRFVDDGNLALLQRLFTEQERVACDARKKGSAACYAARFAAKEAFLKALGLGLRDGLSWQDMEVVNDEAGKPELLLTGKALEVFRARKMSTIFLSISHDGGYAVAMVVLEA